MQLFFWNGHSNNLVKIDATHVHASPARIGVVLLGILAERGVGEKPGATRSERSHGTMPVGGAKICTVEATAFGALLWGAREVGLAISAVETAFGDRASQVADAVTNAVWITLVATRRACERLGYFCAAHLGHQRSESSPSDTRWNARLSACKPPARTRFCMCDLW